MNVPKPINNQIIKDYQSNKKESIRSLSRKYTISTYKVKKILVDSNIRIKTNSEAKAKNTLINDKIFHKINDELPAYALGLLWADGTNNVKNGQFSISLVRSDSLILEKLSQRLLGFHKICYTKKEGNREDSARLLMYDRAVSKHLDSIGFNALRNSQFGIPQIDIQKNIFHHFLRGLWDGDGSIYYINYNKNYAAQFIGSPLLCEYIKIKLKEYYNFNINMVDENNFSFKMRRLNIHGAKKLKTFLDILYDNSTLFLERKYNKYIEFLDDYNKKKNSPHPNKGTVVVRDLSGECFRVRLTDERYVSGELILANIKPKILHSHSQTQ